MSNEIKQIEQQIYELNEKLTALRKASPAQKVPNYTFNTLEGETTLLDMFGDNDKLLIIHNMGQGCRYCMLWADGFNGFLPHLESAMSVTLVSKDAPELQRRFANSRGWNIFICFAKISISDFLAFLLSSSFNLKTISFIFPISCFISVVAILRSVIFDSISSFDSIKLRPMIKTLSFNNLCFSST